MTGMKPKEATELKKVALLENYPMEDTLPEDGLYRYLLQPGEEHDNQCRRAKIEYGLRKLTDLVKSWKTLVIR